VRLESFAKLNLYLRILGRRSDHYHNLKTLFERISLFDSIVLTPRLDKKIKIRCDNPQVPSDKTNLVFRAAKILQDASKVKKGVDIKITKRIPIGSGLGGGSSNAACVLKGLNKLWGLGLSRDKLVKFSRGIGSDVAFFIYDCPFAEGRGRGDIIKPLTALKKLRLWQVVVVPRLEVPTARIYRLWDSLKLQLTRPVPDVKILSWALQKKNRSLIKETLDNNLEPVTARKYPEIRRIKEEMFKAGARIALMSGSGSAVFTLTDSKKEALVLARRLKRLKRFWQVFVTHTI